MKKLLCFLVLGAICFYGSPVFLNAQKIDLEKVRREEAKRRKKLKSSKLKISNSNLNRLLTRGRPAGYVKPPAGALGTDSAPAMAEVAEPGMENRHNREYWQQRKHELVFEINIEKRKMAANELELNRLHKEYLSMDLPLKKAAIKAELDKLTENQSKVTARVSQLEARLAALTDEARRAGAPPGWLR